MSDIIILKRDREVLLDGFIKVEAVEVVVPKELQGRKYSVVTTADAVAVVLTLQETGEVVLVRQPRPAAELFLWEIPAGKIDPGERPYDAAKREVKEETGYTCHSLRLIRSYFPSPGVNAEQIYLYHGVASVNSRENQRLDDDEKITVSHFTPDSVRKLNIVDGKTIMGLALYQPVLIV